METTNTPKKPVATKTTATTAKIPATPRKTAAAPKVPATARTPTAKAPSATKNASKTAGSTAKTTPAKPASSTAKTTPAKPASAAATKTTASKTASAATKATAPKTATKATATKTPSATSKTTAPKNVAIPKAKAQPSVEVPKVKTTSAPKKAPSIKAKSTVKKTPTQATASMNKEQALKSMTETQKKFTQSDREFLENYYKSNAKISKAKKKVKKPRIYKEDASLQGAKGVSSASFFGNSITKLQNARARASSGKGFKKPKKKLNSVLSIILVVVIFLGLAVGTYFVVSNMNKDKGHITVNDIDFEEKSYDTQKLFDEPVNDYQLGSDIDRGLKVRNTSDGIGVYVVFKMEVKEIIPGSDDRVDIDINVEPSLAGGFNNWTVGEVNGVTYYYYNGVLEPDKKVVLFSKYKLLSGGTLNNSDMNGRKVEVTVTYHVLQEDASFGSADVMWQNAPAHWKNLF